jgi:hypothetical protein
VTTLTRILFVLLTLRLLVPPGICLCKLSSPASRLLASTLGKDLPPPPVESEDEHHHHDGCPASPLCEALGLRPAGPGPIELLLVTLLPVDADATLPAVAQSPLDFPLTAAPRPPLCVSCCALRC